MSLNDYTDYYPDVLRVTAFQIPPWVIVNSSESKIISMEGPLVTLLEYLASSMNFRYEIVDNPEYKSGHGKLVDNKWVGLLGLLYRNAVDFTVVPAGPNLPRCNASRMPLPFAYTDLTILSGRNLVDDPQGVAAFDNMSLQVWLCYIACFLMSSFVAWISEGSASLHFSWGRTENYSHKFLRFCWEFVGCVFSKEIRLPMRKTATRIILSIWLIGGLIITTIIGGDMTASMTIVPPEFTIDKLSDIMVKPNLRADIMANSGHMSYVEANNPDLAVRIAMENSGTSMPNLMKESKFRDIVARRAVQINDRYTLLSAIRKYCEGPTNITGFYFAKNLITEVPVSMFFNKRLSKKFMDQVNIRMLRIFQHGVQQDWLRKVHEIKPTCFFQPHGGEYAPLEVDHVDPAFKLWIQGLGVAACVFLIECCLFWIRFAFRHPKRVSNNLKSKLCRKRTKGLDSFISKHHQQRKALNVAASFREVSSMYGGKPISPNDFRRILWRSSNSPRLTFRSQQQKESVVNRSSTVPPITDLRPVVESNRSPSQSVFLSRYRNWRENTDNREPIVRYVDTSSIFDNLY